MKLKKLHNQLMAGVVASSLLVAPIQVSADTSSISDWAGVVLPAASMAVTLFTAGPAPWMVGINTDALSIAAEALVLLAMLNVEYEWEPEILDSYQAAAQAIEDNTSCSTSSVTETGSYTFEVQALTAKGIEAVGVGPDTETLINASTKQAFINGLTMLTSAGNEFYDDITTTELATVLEGQVANEQWLGTQGVARAELALETALQGAIDDGAQNNTATNSETSLTADGQKDIEAAVMANMTKQQTLSSLVGTGKSTAQAMRIQSLMNLELAQRVNLSNMIQGNIVSLQAARLLRQSNPD